MRAIGNKTWTVSQNCDKCGVILQKRYRSIPGTGTYREMGLYCAEHGIMVPESVVRRQKWL